MSTTNHYASLARRIAGIMPILGIALGVLLFNAASRLPAGSPGGGRAVVTPKWQQTAGFDAADWSVIHHRGGGVAPQNLGTLAKRFRLAGTFVVIDTDVRRAILDDLANGGGQLILGEGDQVEDITVVRILQRQVTLRGPAGEEQLWLSFSNKLARAATDVMTAEAGTEDAENDDTGYNTFGGKRVGGNRWLFRRETLMNYYQELMDEPERLLQVFDSLKPVYTADQRIDGYRLQVEGEGDFFKAVGLREGDRVMSVNQMEMTNRRRAEHFIREFVANRASAFVLEVERDGKPEKIIYQVR